MRKGNFDHTLDLTRFILRRERVTSVIWILLLVVFTMVLAPGMSAMFPDADARNNFAESFNNPLMVSMMGPIYGADNYTPGAMYGGLMLLWYIIAVGIMNIFFVIRHSRADEERGRAEVVRSLPVGRLAGIHAVMLAVVFVNAALGLLTGLGLAVMGVETIDFAGSMVYGLATFSAGLIFAAISALFAQLSSSTGGAIGLSTLALGVSYMIRAAGDAQTPVNDYISCLSPLGLAQRSQVFVENRIWPSLTIIAGAVVISAIAYKLCAMRDLGQGFIPARPGRRDAGGYLGSSFGLSWRLLRTPIIVWVLVLFALGASYGSVVADIDGFIGDSPEYLQVIGIPEEVIEFMTDAEKAKVIVEYFGMFVTVMMTLICFVPSINAAMKARAEEKDHRAEHILSRSVGRVKYLSGYVIWAFVSSVLMQLSTAAGLYFTTEAVTEVNPFAPGDLFTAFLAYLPAAWVMIGAAVFMIGLLPKAAGALWGFYGFVAFTSFIGGMLDLPNWLNSLSPMHHIPRIPLEELTLLPLAVLTVIAAALTAAGLVFYGKRDMLTV
jgi:ABC-2 type transport system permease protein